MIGRTNTGGGGGGLNFQVVGNPQPSKPKVNTIWLNTDVKVTGYDFNATEPKNPVQGMAWITIGTSSTIAFNVLKKNGIQVYPISAKQYVNGAWVDVEAKSYQNGAWVDWIRYLYRKGYNLEKNFAVVESATISDSAIIGNGFAAVRTAEKFDFDSNKVKKIIAKVLMGTMQHDYPLNLVVTDGTAQVNYIHANETYPPESAISYSTIRHPAANAENIIELNNVQNITGKHYIGLGLGYHNGTEVLEIRFE